MFVAQCTLNILNISLKIHLHLIRDRTFCNLYGYNNSFFISFARDVREYEKENRRNIQQKEMILSMIVK
jgi:hypothetical protein